MPKQKLNTKSILSNISEAKKELEGLETKLKRGKNFTATDLELSLRHAYHHLNFSWNARFISIPDYRKLSDDDFEKWGLFPKGFDSLIQGD